MCCHYTAPRLEGVVAPLASRGAINSEARAAVRIRFCISVTVSPRDADEELESEEVEDEEEEESSSSSSEERAEYWERKREAITDACLKTKGLNLKKL